MVVAWMTGLSKCIQHASTDRLRHTFFSGDGELPELCQDYLRVSAQ